MLIKKSKNQLKQQTKLAHSAAEAHNKIDKYINMGSSHVSIGRKKKSPVMSYNDRNKTISLKNRQDIELRDDYLENYIKNIKSKENLRKILSTFYLWYISIITIFIFYIIIDPVAIIRNRSSYYPTSIKGLLTGAFFANLMSVLAIMFHYSFKFAKKKNSQFIKAGKRIMNRKSQKK